MKKVLFLIIAAAIGIGIVMLMQSNKLGNMGQSSAIAPITNDKMTPATAIPATPDNSNKPATPAAAPAASDTAPAAAPASDATIPPCPSTSDNSTPGTMMVDGKQVPCMPSSENMQDNAAMHHSMDNTQAAPQGDMGNAQSDTSGAAATQSGSDQGNAQSNIEQKMESTLNGATGNPGAPVNNVNESTK
ncbi:MAG: hypothetical protein ACHQAX_03815 [Gammaproteobacteria bacterium]